MTQTTGQSARWTPPRWLNRLMAAMLHTPGLERLVGRGTALLTFTGRRTGRTYTTPVSYARLDDRIILSGHVSRTWWRSVAARPQVWLRLAGREYRGTARVLTGDDPDAVDLLDVYLERQRMTARALKVGWSSAGGHDPADLRRVLADTVIVEVRLAAG